MTVFQTSCQFFLTSCSAVFIRNRWIISGAVKVGQRRNSVLITDTLLLSIHRMATRLNRPISWHDVSNHGARSLSISEQRAKACFHTLEMLGAGSVSTDGRGTLQFCALGQFG